MINDTTYIKLGIIFLLGYALYLGEKVCVTTMSNLDKIGGNELGKERVAIRVAVNFWIGFAAVVLIIAGIFDLVSKDLFVAFLTATLLSLGIKLRSDFIETKEVVKSNTKS